MEKLYSLLENELFDCVTSDRLFNQYGACDPLVDRKNAAEIRRKNLSNYINSYTETPSILILCEAPGPWGCRFSGIPITSEELLIGGRLPFCGSQSSLDRPLVMTRKKPPYKEYSASIFWETLARFFPRFFVWNTVPLHPHKPEDILSIRTPASREILQFSGLLKKLIHFLRPSMCIAVGKKAEYALNIIGRQSYYVRHPSQGGAHIFRESIARIMEES